MHVLIVPYLEKAKAFLSEVVLIIVAFIIILKK